jgi:hypothetical protein
MEFLGDRGTADNVAPFQHDDLHSCAGKITGAYQAIVAAADDGDVVTGGCHPEALSAAKNLL